MQDVELIRLVPEKLESMHPTMYLVDCSVVPCLIPSLEGRERERERKKNVVKLLQRIDFENKIFFTQLHQLLVVTTNPHPPEAQR